jgi:pyruvate dehydrogenase E2 component (dihydrolipoamide acetyltransferase)
MAVPVVMPKLGMAMTEGEVVKWLKEDGARVEEGEPIVQVMSKKITYEVKASQEGILRQAVAPKTKVPVGAVIGYILAPGEEMPGIPTAPAPQAAERAVGAAASAGGEVLATPMAKRLAREHGIDLREVRGSGPGGRIQESDVLAYLEQRRRAPAALEAPPAARVIPFAGMRRAIAERMTESLQTTAQVTITTEADVTGLVEFVDRLKGQLDISYTAVVVKAVAAALRRHPLLNSTLVGDEIRLLDEINIGVGVALEDGLIVPVVRNADRLTLGEIDRELKRLTAAARAGTLTVDEVTGSTFTISNLGMFGVDAFTPIINPPEAAILGVGRIVEKPAVYRGQLTIRSLMTLSLTFDHRIVDGAPAAAFLQTLAGMLAQPALIFGEV